MEKKISSTIRTIVLDFVPAKFNKNLVDSYR